MDQKQQLLQELEEKMAEMDTVAVDTLLERLNALEQPELTAEDPMRFAAQIKRLDKERSHMNSSTKKFRLAIVAAALVATLSIGVYASGVWQKFTFDEGDKLVSVQTTGEGLSAEQAQELAREAAKDASVGAKAAEEAGANVYIPEMIDYDSAEEAAKALGMPLVLPGSGMEKMTFESASGMDETFGKTLWLNYMQDDKMFGVTVIYTEPQEDLTAVGTVEMDPGSRGSYKSANGITFQSHKEDGAQILVADLGDYEYGLVFFGYSEQELQAIADSVDLSPLK